MIKRERYLKRIRPFLGDDLVKVLTGIRRSGKSVMLELIKADLRENGILDHQFISYNFEQLSNVPYQTAETLHKDILRQAEGLKGRVYLFLDEIQEVSNWEKCVNSLRLDLDCEIFITGSNSTLLSGELATYLAGRYVEFVIYPFSYAEFLKLYEPSTNGTDPFTAYVTLGGMPQLSHFAYDTQSAQKYLLDLYNSVVLKDIVKRNQVRDIDLLERIIAYVTANIGNTFSASSISRFLKSEGRRVSTETVLNYIRYCLEAYLFYEVKRYDLRGKQILASNEKYYIVDHGLREAVYGGNERDINLTLENIVYLELLRREYQVTVGKIGDRKIDFIAEKQGQKIYIQVAYLLASEETIHREFDVFAEVGDHFPKYVVSLDTFDMGREGIKHRNIRDFLLAPEWG